MRQLPRIGWLTVTGGALFLLSISGPAVALATPPARVSVTGETHAAVLSAAAPVTAGGWSDLATVDEVVFAIVGSGAVAGGAYAAVRSNRRGTDAEQAKAMHALNELIGALDSIAVMATVHPSTPTESVLLLRA